jgi:Ca2+-binding EF-hand superfamily protein
METLKLETQVDSILKELKEQLFRRGADGIRGLARSFRVADHDGSGALDKEELEDALGYCGLFLTLPQISALFARFDRGAGDGMIDYDEFLRALAGSLPPRRQALVDRAFAIMDKDGSGEVTTADMAGIFNAKKHPQVLEGKITEEEAMEKFLGSFEGTVKDGVVTKAEWDDYYTSLSASIPSDDYFVVMMENTWMFSEAGKSDPATAAKVARWVNELRMKMAQKGAATETEGEKLRKLFKFFDTDETGNVTIDEFSAAMNRVGISLERRDTRAFFSAYDRDDSGYIDYAEFVRHVCGSD